MRIQKRQIKKTANVRWQWNKRTLILAVGMTLTAVILAANFLYKGSQDYGRVIRLSGDVFLERGGERMKPVLGTVINAYDKVITGEGASIEVSYDDTHKDVIKVGSSSKVVLESAVIEKKTNLYMEYGDILVKLEKLERGSTFKVRTPTVVCGVRGTSFGVTLRDKEADIIDYESRIFVKGLDRDFVEMKNELLLSDGWRVRVKQFEEPSRIERISVEENTAWLNWLKELDDMALAKASGKQKPALGVLAFVSQPIAAKSAFFLNTTAINIGSSISLLAFILYFALVLNLGKVFL